jgi:hypothetical protein
VGYAKEQMQREHENIQLMSELLVPLGYVSECPIHDGIFIDQMAGGEPKEIALELDEADRAQFGTIEDVVSAIEGAIGNAAMDGCPICDKNLHD